MADTKYHGRFLVSPQGAALRQQLARESAEMRRLLHGGPAVCVQPIVSSSLLLPSNASPPVLSYASPPTVLPLKDQSGNGSPPLQLGPDTTAAWVRHQAALGELRAEVLAVVQDVRAEASKATKAAERGRRESAAALEPARAEMMVAVGRGRSNCLRYSSLCS